MSDAFTMRQNAVDQIIQLGLLEAVPGKLVFDSDAVDGEHGAVVISDFDAGGVDVIFTENAMVFMENTSFGMLQDRSLSISFSVRLYLQFLQRMPVNCPEMKKS